MYVLHHRNEIKELVHQLLKKVEELAKEKNVNSIEFTSNKRRLAAHNLYLKNNYLVRDTTYFHKEI